jgi:hypothetical protein
MAVLDPRTRTIGVRLSEDEFATLEQFCVASGARSISDLARTAIWEFVNNQGPQRARSSAPEYFVQMKVLEEKVEQLSVEIASLKERREQRMSVADGRSDEPEQRQLS